MIDRFLLANAEKCIYTRVYDTIELKEKNVMKTKCLATISILVFVLASLTGCGSTSNEVESTEIASETTTTSEASHEHNYTETITVEATCESDGEATYTCECGDTYTEAIPTTGHVFENYVYNEDATYEADGTETATCSVCGAVDTRTAEGSMLTYTYTDMDATKYAKSSVNVRNLPVTDGEKLGGLSTNDEVKVTGQCNETGWYRIEYDGNVAYVSDSYLVDNKVETQTASTQSSGSTAQSSSTSDFPYQLWTMYDNGTIAWFYMPGLDHGYPPEYATAYNATSNFNHSHFEAEIVYDESGQPVNTIRHGWDEAVATAGGSSSMTPTSYYVNGKQVYQYFAW